MPELPDITVYVECLANRVQGSVLNEVRVLNPFLLRTAVPPLGSVRGRHMLGVARLGKRVVLALEGGLHLVIHLMIAGRLHWLGTGAKPAGKSTLALFEFDSGTLQLTEAGSKRRASLHLLPDCAALVAMDPGGIDVFSADGATFAQRLVLENHTLKRALTNPRLFSGIGNAYSDEILHRARLSPLALTRSLDAASTQRLFDATHHVLLEWTQRLRLDAAKPTTARAARRTASCSRIVRCRACSSRVGRATSTPSSDVVRRSVPPNQGQSTTRNSMRRSSASV